MKEKVMSKRNQREEIERIQSKRDDEIDLEDAAEIEDWSRAVRGRFYRPVKKQVTLRLDADLVAWFRSQGKKYQTRMNAALREYMERHTHSR
ncbi:MAG: BrnA antitoxin family protein [Gammaproteobacteria bacterium]|nr:BrnA antitoxin family protein [Gammaproteobacteria bacterium]